MTNSRGSALRSGLLTGVSTLAVSGSAAATVALLGHEFGRNERTDGFLTAYPSNTPRPATSTLYHAADLPTVANYVIVPVGDDGFINLRVVSQIKAGNGPVFNAGERVEAATSPEASLAWALTL